VGTEVVMTVVETGVIVTSCTPSREMTGSEVIVEVYVVEIVVDMVSWVVP
jgi:hypothetical protein